MLERRRLVGKTTFNAHINLHIGKGDVSKNMFSIRERYRKTEILVVARIFYKYQRGQDIAAHVSTIQNMVYKLKVLNTIIDDTMIMTKLFVTLRDILRVHGIQLLLIKRR